jgi:hypothetical protein
MQEYDPCKRGVKKEDQRLHEALTPGPSPKGRGEKAVMTVFLTRIAHVTDDNFVRLDFCRFDA